MRVVDDVTDEFVIDTKAVFEVRGLHESVGEFLAKLGLKPAEHTLDDGLFHFVANDEDVDARIWLVDEYTSDNDELQLATVAEACRHVFFAECYFGDERAECGKIRESGVHAVACDFALLQWTIFPIRLLLHLHHDTLLDEANILEHFDFLLQGRTANFTALPHLRFVEDVFWVHQKKAHEFDPRRATEQFCKDIHNHIIVLCTIYLSRIEKPP